MIRTIMARVIDNIINYHQVYQVWKLINPQIANLHPVVSTNPVQLLTRPDLCRVTLLNMVTPLPVTKLYSTEAGPHPVHCR